MKVKGKKHSLDENDYTVDRHSWWNAATHHDQ